MCNNVVVLNSFTKDFSDVNTTNILGVSLLYPRKSVVLMSDYNSLILMPKFIMVCHDKMVINWGESVYDIQITQLPNSNMLAFSTKQDKYKRHALYHRAAIFPLNYAQYKAVETLENIFRDLGLSNGLN